VVAAAPVAPPRWPLIAALAAGVLGAAGLAMGWSASQRLQTLEQELVRRQKDSSGDAAEARAASRQAQEEVRDTSAKLTLLDARVAEVAVQRSQLEDLIQSLSRSRDENILVDIEAAVRVALQQSAITGSAEPLVATLRQADERLARYNQPRLEGVRRALARDLDRARTAGSTDVSALSIRLDEAVRLVDELPLLSSPEATRAVPAPAPVPVPATHGKPPAAAKASTVSAASVAAAASAAAGWDWGLGARWNGAVDKVWSEARGLIRVTRVDNPEAMLLAPEQAFFLRENLKLRLLNARLALLSRQFDTAQSDLQAAVTSFDRYFDRNSRRTQLASELVKQVNAQARAVLVPRPDDTLAALAAAAAGR
jgi:uroporphyrin-3 C-methyltransferase